jgi:mannose-6-phosphate isomerase-like protein (cupin superfamily)
MNNSQKSVALVEKVANIPWQQFPGHFGGALSKALVGPDNVGTEKIDFRISRYAPAAFVEEHVHQIQEQVYYVLEGEGVLTTDDQKHLMRPNDYVYVPPGVRHSFAKTGTNGLVFLVITTPTHDGEVL